MIRTARDVPGNPVIDRFGARQDEIDAIPVAGKKMFVDDADFLAGTRFDRKDARANQIAAEKFQEGGIAGAGDDGIVNAAGFVAGEEFGFGFEGAALEGEAPEHGAVRHGNDHLGFLASAGAVREFHIHGGGGDLLRDIDADGDSADFHASNGRTETACLRDNDVRCRARWD